MKACLFCGEIEIKEQDESGILFNCGTLVGQHGNRQGIWDCKDRQIAQQTALLREALEVVEALKSYEAKHDGFSCHFCGAGFFTIPHQPDCAKLKAQTLAPKLREALEKLPKPMVNNLHREI